jgi:16S rRNA (guanine527-N7)-methyltransferase
VAAREALALASIYAEGQGADALAEGLTTYAELLKKWQPVQNLVSRETLDSLWTRHLADSLQVHPLLRGTDDFVVDLGSGGGLPAIPLALVSRGTGRRFILVEPTSRKVSFLRTVSRETSLNTTVIGERIEDVSPQDLGSVDVFTSRALSRLSELCRMTLPFWQPDTRGIFHKGREHVEEVNEARARFDFDVITHPSRTSADGVLLEISNLRARSPA